MKKISILIAVILWTGAALFGETGALGNKWFDKQSKNQNVKIIEHDIEQLDVGKETRVILQKNTDVYYFYDHIDKELLSLSYYVTDMQKNILKSKLKLVREYTECKTDILKDIPFKEEQRAYIGALLLFYNSLVAEGYGEESMYRIMPFDDDKAEGTLSIYDYNDDTRVYIYENIIEGQTVVVYVPHEQDY